MPKRTSIPYATHSSNPIYAVDEATGKRGWFCTRVSEGCRYCYSCALNKRFGNGLDYGAGKRDRVEWRFDAREMDRIVKMSGPADIFVCDMIDAFHADVPDGFLDHLFAGMSAAGQHTFLLLTKRPERMRHYIRTARGRVYELRRLFPGLFPGRFDDGSCDFDNWPWPPSNVWIGVSAENQRWADRRIPLLLQAPVAFRWVSLEPLLGPIELVRWLPDLDWVVVGGESGGPPERALVLRRGSRWEPKVDALTWIRSIRDQCQAADVHFYFKGWGGARQTSGGNLLDGRTWEELPFWPCHLRLGKGGCDV